MIFGQYVPIIVFKVKQLKRSGDLEEFRSDIGSFKKGKKKKKEKEIAMEYCEVKFKQQKMKKPGRVNAESTTLTEELKACAGHAKS